MFIEIILTTIIITLLGIIIACLKRIQSFSKDVMTSREEYSRLLSKNDYLQHQTQSLSQSFASNNVTIEVKTLEILKLSSEKARFEEQCSILLKEREEMRQRIEIYRLDKEKLGLSLIQMQEKASSQAKLESDLKILLESAKLEITNQNRAHYMAIQEKLEVRNKELNREAEESFSRIIEKDIKETFTRINESLTLQQEKLVDLKKPVDFFTKILSSSKEAGQHGEQTIVNMLEQMGMRHGIDYLTQFCGRGSQQEKLIADVVLMVTNSGKTDVLIIDSKSSTKLGGGEGEFMQSIEQSFQTFSRKDYKSAVERGLKEEYKNIEINHTYVFMYLPFDKMLSKISEEKPEFLRKMRDKEIGILTPVILDFLLDSIKLYSAKLEMNMQAEDIMKDVKTLIERTSRVLDLIKDLGKTIGQASKKYTTLRGSVSRMFVPAVNKMAKPLNVKSIIFDDLNEEELKYIELSENDEAA